MSDTADATAEARPNPRKVREGVVTSAAGDKTITVKVTDRVVRTKSGVPSAFSIC